MNPGATTRPCASIVRVAGPATRPTAAMRPSRTPTEPDADGPPVPSTMRALVMRRSKGRGCCAASTASAAASVSASFMTRELSLNLEAVDHAEIEMTPLFFELAAEQDVASGGQLDLDPGVAVGRQLDCAPHRLGGMRASRAAGDPRSHRELADAFRQ